MTSISFEPFFSADARAFVPSAIRALARFINDPSVISLAAGVPNPETFPAAELAKACSMVLAALPKRALQYDVTMGYQPLREKVAARSAGKGVPARAAETILTTGSQQAVDLMARVLLDPGDVVLVESPTFVGGLITFAGRRAESVGVVRTEEGIDLDHLERTVASLRASGRTVKVLYTIPNFQNPSGLAMTRGAKDALAACAARLGLLVFEDDPYGELLFDESGRWDVTPLAARIPERTVYFGSFSKTLSAGFRVGWLHGPAPLVAKAEIAKQAADLCSSTFTHAVLDAWLAENDYDAHIRGVQRFYRGRKEVLLGALREAFPAATRFTDPAGGLFLWAELPGAVDTKELLPRCVETARVAYVPGEPFTVDGSARNAFRATFAKETAENLVEGARRLGAFFRAELG